MEYIIYYRNQGEDRLPIRKVLKECGVKCENIRLITDQSKSRDGCLAIVHHTDLRQAIIDNGKNKTVPLWLKQDGIVIFASSDGGVRHKPSTSQNSKGQRCHVFGINKQPSQRSGSAHFLDQNEWREIITWAKSNEGKSDIDSLKASASAVVKKLLWPDDDDRRSRMALAVLCQGFLFCFCRLAAKKDLGEDVIKALKIMECTGGQKLSAEQQKEISGIWESVQLAEWWLRVFRAENGGGALKNSERANAIKVVKGLLGKDAKSLQDSRKMASMLENSKVNDANVVARVFIRLEKELA